MTRIELSKELIEKHEYLIKCKSVTGKDGHNGI